MCIVICNYHYYCYSICPRGAAGARRRAGGRRAPLPDAAGAHGPLSETASMCY